MPWTTFALFVALAGASSPVIHPVTETLSWVPPDPPIVLVIRDARTHTTNLSQSPFAEWVNSQPRSITVTPQYKAIAAGVKFLVTVLGTTPHEFLDEIVGDALVMTFSPATKSTPEIGVIYGKPRRPEVAHRLFEQLSKFQLASGEVTKIESLTHAGQTYTARRKPAGAADFFAERTGVFAFSSHEPTIREFLTRAPNSTHAKRLTTLGADESFAIALFAPRAFDAELQARRDAAPDAGDRAFLTQFLRVWTALDALAITITPDNNLDFSVAAIYRPEAMPTELREVAETRPAGNGEQPVGAILNIRVPLTLPKLIRLFKSFLAEAAQKEIDLWLANGVGPAVGRDRLPELLQAIGPAVDFTLLSPPEGAAVPAWRLGIDLDQPSVATQSAARDGLATLSQFLKYEYNRTHRDQVSLVTTGDVTTAAGNGLPESWQPSYTVGQGAITLASRPELLTPLVQTPQPNRPPATVDTTILNAYLHTHQLKIATWISQQNGKSAAEVTSEIETIKSVLDALKRLDMHIESTGHVARFRLSMTFIQPLKPLQQ